MCSLQNSRSYSSIFRIISTWTRLTTCRWLRTRWRRTRTVLQSITRLCRRLQDLEGKEIKFRSWSIKKKRPELSIKESWNNGFNENWRKSLTMTDSKMCRNETIWLIFRESTVIESIPQGRFLKLRKTWSAQITTKTPWFCLSKGNSSCLT